MDQTGDFNPSPPLLVLGDADAAVCADGFCQVPVPPQDEEVPDAD
jgi:hypothetical protein